MLIMERTKDGTLVETKWKVREPRKSFYARLCEAVARWAR